MTRLLAPLLLAAAFPLSAAACPDATDLTACEPEATLAQGLPEGMPRPPSRPAWDLEELAARPTLAQDDPLVSPRAILFWHVA
jgi:hypothetical protein